MCSHFVRQKTTQSDPNQGTSCIEASLFAHVSTRRAESAAENMQPKKKRDAEMKTNLAKNENENENSTTCSKRIVGTEKAEKNLSKCKTH